MEICYLVLGALNVCILGFKGLLAYLSFNPYKYNMFLANTNSQYQNRKAKATG